jgi:hypothetical protein
MSCGSAASSAASTPAPDDDPAATARERKARRGPKREPARSEPTRSRCDDAPPPELVRGVEQLNAGELFEQHETLEHLWRATDAPVRALYHGILQVGVGLHHWSNGNFHGATVLLAEGVDRLRPFAPSCQGVDVAALIADASRLREELLRLGPQRMRERDARRALRVRIAG